MSKTTREHLLDKCSILGFQIINYEVGLILHIIEIGCEHTLLLITSF